MASNAVSRLIARAYEDRFGLTVPQWRLVAVLAEDGPAVQAALVARTRMDKVTVSRAAQALVRRALVERAAVEDARSHTLSLTSAGVALHGEIAPLALELEAELLAGVSASDVREMTRWLRHLETAAEQASADHEGSRTLTPR